MKVISSTNRFWSTTQTLVFTLTVIILSGCGSRSSDNNDTIVNSDASLSALALSGLALDQLFQPTQSTYTASVGYLQTSVTVSPVAADTGATITVNGADVDSGSTSTSIALIEGENLINLVVTAGDGITTQSYSITLSRESAAMFAQQAYLKVNNANTFDEFGTGVAISGDTLVVGADGSEHTGAAYVFTRSDGAWNQQAILKASNAEVSDRFGAKVTISDDTLVVGAPHEDSSARDGEADNSALYAGAVYIFTRNNGLWNQQAFLKASNAEAEDGFGRSVGISGDTLVVGAPQEDSSARNGEADNSALDAGAVYVFTRNNGLWNQQAFLKATNAEAEDGFGGSVGISGDTLVVGAPREDSSARDGEADNSALDAGAVYIFTRNNGLWNQQAVFKATNAEEGDGFGASLAILDDTLVVGATGEDSSASGGKADNSTTSAGAAYVFTRSGGAWTEQAYLKASNAGEMDGFGNSVAISGDTLVVGAFFESSSVSGGEADNSALNAGAAYVFTRNSEIWSQQTYLKASNAEWSDLFGFSVAISGDTLVVGAPNEDSGASSGEADNSVENAGAVYTWQ
ncbi:MAG: cadherin-like beta sandwich domain-containing protein [Candidatus Thiodiazotropha endolucinida]|nr:cadherin-like beta sandwich domain-containing protein [Candidatus Thiodiazotropha taylori]MCG8120058.1 cadherin-like beta sandwich domain-containing protein [Candidatus Thiodiazotropha taylori]MCW4289821.1 cadherin-like beta sandwich domain-containing protein [Candidatus Thiodiazotropha endolucinida]MCW4295746.1 cadherin-like beta sandwich domain-containing protein [Candidatus Thiodiazotropha endolucinida]